MTDSISFYDRVLIAAEEARRAGFKQTHAALMEVAKAASTEASFAAGLKQPMGLDCEVEPGALRH